jgi:hypothetical protein
MIVTTVLNNLVFRPIHRIRPMMREVKITLSYESQKRLHTEFRMQLTRYQHNSVDDVNERQVFAEGGDVGMRHSVDEEYRSGCDRIILCLDKKGRRRTYDRQ